MKLAIASALTLAAFSASAQMYGEVGVSAVTVEESFPGNKLKASPVAIRGIFGYEINPNFAVEGLVAFGMSDDDVKLNGNTVGRSNFKVDNMFGIYAKPKVKLTPELEGFVRAGFAHSKATTSIDGKSSSGSLSSFSYGLGVNYALNKTTSVNVDYMSYLDKNESKDTGFTFGVGYKF
jgi:opacity protein-like surface antigen